MHGFCLGYLVPRCGVFRVKPRQQEGVSVTRLVVVAAIFATTFPAPHAYASPTASPSVGRPPLRPTQIPREAGWRHRCSNEAVTRSQEGSPLLALTADFQGVGSLRWGPAYGPGDLDLLPRVARGVRSCVWLRPERAWIEQCWTIAALAGAAAPLNWLTTGDHLIHSLSHRHLWPIAGMDLLLLAGAVIAVLAARKLRHRAATPTDTVSPRGSPRLKVMTLE